MLALLAAIGTPSAGQQPSLPPSTPGLQVYQCPADKLDATVARLRGEYQAIPEVRIAADVRTSQILVYAPPEVQAQIAQRMGALAPAAEAAPPRPAAASPPPAPADSRAPKSSTIALRNITARRFEDAIVGALGKRLVSLPPAGSGVRSYQLMLAGAGTIRLDLHQQSNQATVQGSVAAVDSCLRLIQTLDTAESGPNRSTRLVPLQRGSTPAVRRAVDAIQTSAGPRTPHGPLVTMLFQQPGEAEATAPAQPPAGAPGAQQPEREGGAGLIGPVTIELMPELDLLIIRGNVRDVAQVQELIDQIEKLSAVTAPAVEIYKLRHVDCGAMGDLVGPLYDDVFSLRQGYVSITPLIKPNALLFVGRKESVQTIIDLVKQLDRPVSPETQFQVFRLQNAAALTAQQTILEFYALRGGLGPRVRTTADYRSNALIVQASRRDLKEIAELITRIDTPSSAAVNELRVFELENSLSDELAPILQGAITGQQVTRGMGVTGFPGALGAAGVPGMTGAAGALGMAGQKSTALQFVTIDAQGKRLVNSGILTDVRIMSDYRSNTLLVSAPAECMDLIEALIRQLDKLPTVEAKIKVFTIQNADATTLSTMLQQLFMRQVSPGQAGMPPTVTQGESLLVPLQLAVDQRTNSIIVIGSVGDINVAEAILLRLDESDVRLRKSVVYPLKNAPADSVSNAITQFLTSVRSIQTMGFVSAFEEMQREVVVVPEMVTNSLIVSATPRFFDEIIKIVEELDARPPMVMIQVLIGQVTLTNTDEFGIELGLQDGVLFDRSLLSNIITAPFSTATYAPGFAFMGQPLGNNNPQTGKQNLVGTQGTSNFSVGRTNKDLGFGGLVLSASSENVSVVLRALAECHRLEILSRPQIMTLNNQPAYILVGQYVPTITGVSLTTYGQTNSVQFQNVGLSMTVTPRISPDGLVVMQLIAERSDVGPEAEGIPISISASGEVIRSPRINTTNAQTTVSAANGQTVVLGGLITKNKSEFHRKVPWLGDIPVLGRAFRLDGTRTERTELLIIMTPHIVKNEGDAEAIRRVEAERMHWCVADVLAMHGGSDLRGRGAEWSDAETTVIYPDANPGGLEPIPVPGGVPGGRETKQGPASPPPYPPPVRPRLDEPPADPTSRSSGAGPGGAATRQSATQPPIPQATQASQQWPSYPTTAQAATYQPRYQPSGPPAVPGIGGPGQVVPSTYNVQQQPAGAPPPQYPQPTAVQPIEYRQYPQYWQPPMVQAPPQTPPYR